MFFLLIACSKTDIRPPVENLSASAEDMLSTSKSYPVILMAHQWMYNSFYIGYTDQNHKGNPEYVRGAKNNSSEIIGTDRITFNSNHNFIQTEDIYTYNGTWRLSDDSEFLVMKYNWGTDEDSILICNRKHLNFINRFGYHAQQTSYTELIPAN
jgi:hypothetical protein